MARPIPQIDVQLPIDIVEFHMMLSLAEAPLDSYRLMQRIDEKSNGTIKIGTKTVYDTIRTLVNKRWITEATTPIIAGQARRKHYKLTALGARVMVAETRRLALLVKQAYQLGLFHKGSKLH